LAAREVARPLVQPLAEDRELLDDGVGLVQTVTLSTPGRPPLGRLIVSFRAEYAGGSLRPEPGKIDAVQWWDEPPPAFSYDVLAQLPIPVTGE